MREPDPTARLKKMKPEEILATAVEAAKSAAHSSSNVRAARERIDAILCEARPIQALAQRNKDASAAMRCISLSRDAAAQAEAARAEIAKATAAARLAKEASDEAKHRVGARAPGITFEQAKKFAAQTENRAAYAKARSDASLREMRLASDAAAKAEEMAAPLHRMT